MRTRPRGRQTGLGARWWVAAFAVVIVCHFLSTSARGADMLGATLDTSGTWVAVTSRATVATHVVLTTEGDVQLAETEADLEPGERWEVPFTGTGLGWVGARMEPLNIEGSSGAVELRAWVRYVAPPTTDYMPLALLALGLLLAVAFMAAVHRRNRHAR